MTVSAQPPVFARRTYLGLAVLLALLCYASLPLRPLFNPDEGRYAEIPREMLATHDWVIPHLNGLAYIEKPPLQYWATAAALRLFGLAEFGARFYTASCAIATLLAVWLLARRLWGAAAAWRSAYVLASMMLFVIMGQLLTLDMGLTFFMTSSLVAFLIAQTTISPPPGYSRRWMLFAWATAAFGVLSKGLIAAAVPAAVLLLYCAYTRSAQSLKRLHILPGLALFLAIAIPWHWLAAVRMPDFLEFFFVHEHFSRYLTPSANREEPWWFFGAVFLLGSIPWTLPALRAVAMNGRQRLPRGQFDPALFLRIWVIFILIFFSFSDSKLIPYVLPAMPGLALLIGSSSDGALGRDLRWTACFTLLIAAAMALAAGLESRLLEPSERNQYFALLARPLIEVAILLSVCGGYILLRRGRGATHAAIVLGAGWCLAGLLLVRAAGLVAPVYSGIVLAHALDAIPPGAPIFSVGTYDQTLPFYAKRTVTLVAYRGELDFGLRHDPSADIATVADFVARWLESSTGFAVMEKSMFEDLKSQGVPMREIAHDIRRVLVARL